MSAHLPHPPRRRDPKADRRAPPAPPKAMPQVRHLHRERDFGIGYGNSSGYGREEHYVHPWGPDRFRCV